MEKIMKSSGIKTIVVQLTADNVQEIDIDTNLFDDPYMEAATRAVEKSKMKNGSMIRPVTTCWEKTNPKKGELYNSYWVLVNAACYTKAELLREKFKAQTDCDLAKEPVCGNKRRMKK
jgi:hypothetical protein